MDYTQSLTMVPMDGTQLRRLTRDICHEQARWWIPGFTGLKMCLCILPHHQLCLLFKSCSKEVSGACYCYLKLHLFGMDSIGIEYYGPFMVPARGSAGWLQRIGMLEAVTRP
jgi:hypothetical protein